MASDIFDYLSSKGIMVDVYLRDDCPSHGRVMVSCAIPISAQAMHVIRSNRVDIISRIAKDFMDGSMAVYNIPYINMAEFGKDQSNIMERSC